MSQPCYIIDVEGLDALLQALRDAGYQTLGPRLGDGGIEYGGIECAADLPRGWTERQSPGRYRVERRDDDRYFGFTVPGMSWKTFLHPPRLTLMHVTLDANGLRFVDADTSTPRYAFIGVRPCELAAIEVQDKVFVDGLYTDTHYRRRRDAAFVVGVQCGVAAPTCFCTSMGTGPRADAG